MNPTIENHLKTHLEDIATNNWVEVLPKYELFSFLSTIYNTLIQADIKIDLNKLFKDYGFTHAILRSPTESLSEFEARWPSQFQEDINIYLPSSFNNFEFDQIIKVLPQISYIDYDSYWSAGGDIHSKPTKGSIKIELNFMSPNKIVLNLENDDSKLDIIFSHPEIIRNACYFPYGIGYNKDKLKEAIDSTINKIIKDLNFEVNKYKASF